MKACYEVFFFFHIFLEMKGKNHCISHILFSMVKESKTIQGQQGDAMQDKSWCMQKKKKQILKRIFKARGLVHMGSKEGTHPWCWIDNFFLFHLWFRVTKIVLWIFHVCGRSPMGLVIKKLQNSRCLFVSNNV